MRVHQARAAAFGRDARAGAQRRGSSIVTRRLYLTFAIVYVLALVAVMALVWLLEVMIGDSPNGALGIVAFMPAVLFAGRRYGDSLEAPPPSGAMWLMSLGITIIAVVISALPLALLAFLYPEQVSAELEPLRQIDKWFVIGALGFFALLYFVTARLFLGIAIRDAFNAKERAKAG